GATGNVRGGGRRELEVLEERRAQQQQRQREVLAPPVLVLPEKLDGDGTAPEKSGTGRGSSSSSSRSRGNRNSGVSVSSGADSVVDGPNAGGGNKAKGSGPPPPLVFVLQNNGYFDEPDDFQQNFLDEVHRIQRKEIGIGADESEEAELAAVAAADEAAVAPGSASKQSTGVDGIGDANTYGGDETDSEDGGRGVFLVDNSLSLYEELSCYRMDPSSHYR
ncbi:unnamed protein product, partial [Pylaiella littoralis]